MGYSRPRGGSLPLPMDTTINLSTGRRTIATHLEGVVLDDMDALVSVHHKPTARAAPPPPPPQLVARASSALAVPSRRGSTSNCFSRRNPRRRRRSSNPARLDGTDGTDTDRATGASHGVYDEIDQDEHDTTFFVDEDEPVPVLAGSVLRVATTEPTSVSDRGVDSTRRPYGTPNRPRRATSMPTAPPPSDPRVTTTSSSTATQRRHTTQPATKVKRRKHVTFKNAYEPEIMPETRAPVQSYDDLLFNVAGLYHTLSYLHDADYFDDGAATDTSSAASSSSNASAHEPPPPPERSMQLMIAEFLYRSAVYLGYPPDDNVWVPGFREKKKFSSNDVKRWRRLALFDWDAEERAFAQDEAARLALSRASSRTSSRWTTRLTSTRMTASGTGSSRETSTYGLRATVSNWLHLGRGSSTTTSSNSTRGRSPSATLAPFQAPTKERPLPPLVLDPPLVPAATDLTKLVEVANACVSYGAVRFSERQIRKLCNVPIRK